MVLFPCLLVFPYPCQLLLSWLVRFLLSSLLLFRNLLGPFLGYLLPSLFLFRNFLTPFLGFLRCLCQPLLLLGLYPLLFRFFEFSNPYLLPTYNPVLLLVNLLLFRELAFQFLFLRISDFLCLLFPCPELFGLFFYLCLCLSSTFFLPPFSLF